MEATMRKGSPLAVATLLAALTLSAYPTHGEEPSPAGQPGVNMTEMKFVTFPGMPTCATGSVQNGDPTKGPSIIISKVSTGCTFPWHWHTPGEHLMMVSGAARIQMKDGKPVTLRAGGFALMPSHHVHQFTCSQTCVLYIYSDAAFDMHYVDTKEQEISPDAALKPLKETAATEMK
jgi:quercetin dioxygenase-like cupin family protein